MSLKNLQVPLKSSPQNGKFFCHTQRIKIKLYLTFVIDSMTSNLALISDRHKKKSAPKEYISLRIPHVTAVL